MNFPVAVISRTEVERSLAAIGCIRRVLACRRAHFRYTLHREKLRPSRPLRIFTPLTEKVIIIHVGVW